MLRKATSIFRIPIRATDGEIGSVYDFLYDDQSWALRYLVVDTGAWLGGRRVLISPQAFRTSGTGRSSVWGNGAFTLSLTREQVESSPPIRTDQPVSRQQEVELFDHYAWNPYWLSSGAAYPLPVAIYSGPVPEQESEEKENDPHLRSMREVEGYHIQAANGEIGHLEDYLLDEDTWLIRYIIVDTRNWLPGKKVLVSTEWVTGVDWSGREVRVDVQREAIRKAPEFDASHPVDRDLEEQIYRHYGRPPYWGSHPD